MATRPRLRPTGPRCLRSAVPRAQGHPQGQAGQGTGLDVGATRGAGLMIAPLAMLILPECLHAPATQRAARGAGQFCAPNPTAANPPVNRGSPAVTLPANMPLTLLTKGRPYEGVPGKTVSDARGSRGRV